MNTQELFERADAILDAVGREERNVIAILQGIQEHYRYLPREVFPYLAEKLGVSEARLYSVATFYENFSLDPKGHFVIKVCDYYHVSADYLLGIDTSCSVNVAGLTEGDIHLVHILISHLKSKNTHCD